MPRYLYLVASCCLFAAVLVGLTARPGQATDAKRTLPQVDAQLYATTPEPLKPADCAQCHVVQFGDLKQAGGKHRFSCQECHHVFHAYNPRKNNYDALMPKCSACHAQPHGPGKLDCLSCHQNPHAPRKVPAVDRLAGACADCHAGPASKLKAFPSAHSKQGCQTCHYERHGYIPNCFECHKGHFKEQAIIACGECHQQVHAPLQITFRPDADVRTCSGCHEPVYTKWKGTPSKHGSVMCGMCHQQHGKIPDCRECHAEPHDKRQLEMFPKCLTCHLDVHDLPVKKKKK